MSYSHERINYLTKSFGELRPILVGNEAASGYLKFFDEFVGECEFGLALHAVCDYILEGGVPGPDVQTIDRIHHLHTTLEISDDCVERMRPKIS